MNLLQKAQKKSLIILVFSFSCIIINAKIIFEPSTNDQITEEESLFSSPNINANTNTGTSINNKITNPTIKNPEKYDLLEKNELVKKLVECCLTGDYHAIDSLFLKIRKKLEQDNLFSCGMGELGLLHELKDKGLVHGKCTSSFNKQIKKLDELAEKRISSADDESALAALKPHVSKAHKLKFAFGKDSLDVKTFLKNIKNELRSSGCSEKDGLLIFEPGTYIDALSDLSIILASPAFFTDEDIRMEAVKTLQSAYEYGHRHFEASPLYPLVNKCNKEYLIKYYKELLGCLINDYLKHEAFATDEHTKATLLALREKIINTNAIPHLLQTVETEKKALRTSPHKIKSNSLGQDKIQPNALGQHENKQIRRTNKANTGSSSNNYRPKSQSNFLFPQKKHANPVTPVITAEPDPEKRKSSTKKTAKSNTKASTKVITTLAQEPAAKAAQKEEDLAAKTEINKKFTNEIANISTAAKNARKKTVVAKKPRRKK